jgi:uncharacterized membrane protein
MPVHAPLSWRDAPRYPIWALLFLAVFYASISFVNHACYRTFGLDLGLYTNALYDYAHFRFNDSAAFREMPENLLGDHFDLILPLVSPLSWVFRSWTLLLVQWLAVLFGAWGVYRFARLRSLSQSLSTVLLLAYGLHFGVIGAMGFDYHGNAFAAGLLPWFFVALQERRTGMAWCLFFLMLFARENMSLWLFFVTTGCWLVFREQRRPFLLGMVALSTTWFIVVTGLIMPALHAGGTLSQFRYSVMGNDLPSAVLGLFTHPAEIVSTLFRDHRPVPVGKSGIKPEFWIIFLLSGGWMLLRVPVFLWMALPILLQKLLNDQVQVWGVNDHYNVEFAPLIALAGVLAVARTASDRLRSILASLLLAAGVVATVRTMDHVQAFVRRENIRIYQAPHWKPIADPAAVVEAIRQIPDTGAVSAHPNLYPRVAWRDRAYIFPIIGGSEYLLLLEQGNPFPLDSNTYRQRIDSLRRSEAWKVESERNGVLLLRRRWLTGAIHALHRTGAGEQNPRNLVSALLTKFAPVKTHRHAPDRTKST